MAITVIKADRQQPERQLYSLFRRLDAVVEDRNELGLIIGYSIVASLLGMTTNTSLRKERRLEALVAVHDGLEKTLEDCTSRGSYPALLSLQTRVENFYISEGEAAEQEGAEQKKRKAARIKRTLFSQPGNFYFDQLRKKGLRIVDRAYERGPYYKRNNIIKGDYLLLESCFAEKGGFV